MSPLQNISAVATLGGSYFTVFKSLFNASFGYEVLTEKLTAVELPDILHLTSTNAEDLSVVAAAGTACFLTFTGIWSICRKLTRSRRAEDTIPKKRLLQLIKTAYLPGCTERTIEQLNRLDVNEKVSSSGLTYFLCACLSGAEDLIKYMIRIGANVNEETCEGDSALYLATYAVLHSVEPSIDALRVLIKAGCSVNKQNGRGYTPLHRAASKGSLKVIQYLLLEGADPYIANNAGVYPIDSAVCAGHTEAAQLLKLKFPSPYVWDVVEPHTPLHIRMGLQSPQRKLTLQSSKRLKLRNVFT